MSEKEDKIYRYLVKLFKMFQNRPNHLAKYMIDKMAFTDFFIEKLLESEKLTDLEDSPLPSFKDIEEMNNYFDIFDDYKSKKKSPEKIIKDLSNKLEECLRLEKYEDAIRIRDYMAKLNKKKEK